MNRPLSLIALFSLITLLFAACGPTATPEPTATVTPTITLTSTPTRPPTFTPSPIPGDTPEAFILSLSDNGYNHLFAYSPTRLPLTRLTSGLWNDVTPSYSPDGNKIVFASDRNEYWDIYQLDLESGQVSRLTDSPDYDGNPSWSPDSLWVIYESLLGDQMEIFIVSTANPGQVIQLTSDPALDQDPVWSPQGRQIAFVSNRSGNDDIWLANLDQPDAGRFVNLTNTPGIAETRPIWSPDGTHLAWSSHVEGQASSIYVWNYDRPKEPAHRVGVGDWPVWNPSGDQISTRISEANQDYLVTYSLGGILALPPIALGNIRGLDWRIRRVGSFPIIFYNQSIVTPTPLWDIHIQLITDIPNQRGSVVELHNLQAPHPYLHDAVDEAFNALRERVIQEAGWDVLGNLESAYTPLSSSLDPGRGEDWLFTGRAFAINPLTTNAGWMQVIREEVNGQTYWRLYVRALAQDGSAGEPLRTQPWDLNARYNVNPQAYEQGGAYTKTIPTGYWIDFTALARDYGWSRIPALNNWRTYYKGTQFNEFVLTGGLDWRSAMLQLYPSDVFVTPTVVIPPSRTPSPTPTGYRYKTPTPTPSFTPTRRPTYTPSP